MIDYDVIDFVFCDVSSDTNNLNQLMFISETRPDSVVKEVFCKIYLLIIKNKHFHYKDIKIFIQLQNTQSYKEFLFYQIARKKFAKFGRFSKSKRSYIAS